MMLYIAFGAAMVLSGACNFNIAFTSSTPAAEAAWTAGSIIGIGLMILCAALKYGIIR